MKDNSFSLASLYQHHGEKIFNLCYRMTGNYHDAQDITQDVFIKVCKKIQTFREDSTISTWLYSIGVRSCIDHFRKKKSFTNLLTRLWKHSFNQRNQPGPQIPLLQKSQGMEILNRLSPRERAILLLKNYLGFNYDEISKMMDTTPNSVGVELNRIRKKILKFKSNEGDE